MSSLEAKLEQMNHLIRKQRIITTGTYLAGFLTAALLACTVKYEFGKMKIVRPVVEMQKDMNRKYELANSYQHLFRQAFDNAKNHFLENGYVNKLSLKSKLIEDVANEYDLNPDLLKDMMKANRVYAKVDISSKTENNRVNFINLLDPYLAVMSPRTGEVMPESNLREGAKRLSGLVKKMNGDIDKALYAFYSPFAVEGCENTSMEGLFDHTPDYFETIKIKEDVANLVYSIRKGMCWSGDGGIFTVWLREDAPKGYPFATGKETTTYGSLTVGGSSASDYSDFRSLTNSRSLRLNR